MKKYILAICDSQPDIRVKGIFAKAADTNFDMSKFKQVTVSNEEKSKFDKILSKLDSQTRKSQSLRKCITDKSRSKLIKLFVSKYDQLEKICGTCDKYSGKSLEKSFKGKEEYFGELQKVWKSCG